MNRIDLNAPLWQLTIGEFIEIMKDIERETPKPVEQKPERRIVHGLKGIQEIFGCSMTTAQRIKNSGVINKAITQVGRKPV